MPMYIRLQTYVLQSLKAEEISAPEKDSAGFRARSASLVRSTMSRSVVESQEAVLG